LAAHTQTTVLDATSNQKRWNFINGSSSGWDNGLTSQYLAYQGTSTVMRTVNTSWTQDDNGQTTIKNPRVASTVTIPEEGATQTKTEQDTDSNGNVTAVREYAAGSGAPGALYRTTTTTYLSDSNYTSRNILNRPVLTKVWDGAATTGTLLSTTTTYYDN